MPAPKFTLPVTSVSPSQSVSTKAQLSQEIDRVIEIVYDQANPEDAVAAAASAAAAAASAALAGSRADDITAFGGFRDRADVATLLADTLLTYTPALDETVVAGETIRTRKEGFSYAVAASGASDHHLTTAGGVKFYYTGSVFSEWTVALDAVTKDPTLTGPQAAAIIGRKAVDAAWFGIRPGTSDQRTVIQNAINAASQEGIYHLNLGGGLYVSDGPLYTCYDVTLNPDFAIPTDASATFQLRGTAAPHRTAFISPIDIEDCGTILKFENTTGNGLVVSNGVASDMRGVIVSDMGISGGSTGSTLYIDYAPQFSRFQNLVVGHFADAGNGIHLRSSWVNLFDNVDVHGRPGHQVREANTIGFFHDNGAGTVGGGQNVFNNLTVSHFTIGHKKGLEYSATDRTAMRVDTYIGLQFRYCVEGAQFLQGAHADITGSWNEYSDVCHWRISDSCSGVSARNVRMASGDVTEACIVLGRPSGTASEGSYRYFKLDGSDEIACNTGRAGIRKYASSAFEGGHLHVDNVFFSDNGGAAIMVDIGEKGGIIMGQGNDFTQFRNNDTLDNIVANADLTSSRADACRGGPVPTRRNVNSASVSMTSLWYMPEFVLFNTSTTSTTVTLPADRTTFKGWGQVVTLVKESTANDLVINPGSGNTVDAAATYTISGTRGAARLIPRDTGTGIAWILA